MMTTKRTERQRQAQRAEDEGQVWTHVFRCDDGAIFEAVAETEKGALRVLNAEKPGVRARYCGVKRSANIVAVDADGKEI